MGVRVKSFLLVLGLIFAAATAVSAENMAYKPNPGPYPIVAMDDFELYEPVQEKVLKVRIVYPDGRGPFPVVFFSHGGGRAEYLSGYNAFTDHWASHGYVVLQPTHLDAELSAKDFGKMVTEPFTGADPLTQARMDDIRYLADMLNAIEWSVQDLRGKIDQNQMVMAGHSRGSATTMMVAGVVLEDPRDGTLINGLDERFKAFLFLSEPGNAPFMPKQPWRQVSEKPVLVTTGTNDFGAVARREAPFRYRALKAENIGGPKRKLFITDLDQHFGGLISGKDTVGKGPDYDALNIVKGVTTAFMDAHTKDDWVAVQMLWNDEIKDLTAGRAEFVN